MSLSQKAVGMVVLGVALVVVGIPVRASAFHTKMGIEIPGTVREITSTNPLAEKILKTFGSMGERYVCKAMGSSNTQVLHMPLKKGKHSDGEVYQRLEYALGVKTGAGKRPGLRWKIEAHEQNKLRIGHAVWTLGFATYSDDGSALEELEEYYVWTFATSKVRTVLICDWGTLPFPLDLGSSDRDSRPPRPRPFPRPESPTPQKSAPNRDPIWRLAVPESPPPP